MQSKVMFEIYRDSAGRGEYRVIYFTELEETERDREIDRALAGEHLFDGYFLEQSSATAKSSISALLKRLNTGEQLDQVQLRTLLEPFSHSRA